MSDKKSGQPANATDHLTEAEITARFESTVRRMANTKPSGTISAKKKESQRAKRNDERDKPK